jgi:2-dehydropantoate 2-reductase
MTAPNTVRMTFFNSPNYMAALSPRGQAIVSSLAGMLSSANFTTEAPGDIRSFIWEKSILNSAMAHGAIAQLTMKEVMDSPEAVEIVKAIIDESVCVAEAEGIKFRENFREFSLKYLESGGNHRPSMAVDLGNGCKTEIDYLNGRLAAYGRKHGIPTPYNRIVTILIHLIEQSLPFSGRQHA